MTFERKEEDEDKESASSKPKVMSEFQSLVYLDSIINHAEPLFRHLGSSAQRWPLGWPPEIRNYLENVFLPLYRQALDKQTRDHIFEECLATIAEYKRYLSVGLPINETIEKVALHELGFPLLLDQAIFSLIEKYKQNPAPDYSKKEKFYERLYGLLFTAPGLQQNTTEIKDLYFERFFDKALGAEKKVYQYFFNKIEIQSDDLITAFAETTIGEDTPNIKTAKSAGRLQLVETVVNRLQNYINENIEDEIRLKKVMMELCVFGLEDVFLALFNKLDKVQQEVVLNFNLVDGDTPFSRPDHFFSYDPFNIVLYPEHELPYGIFNLACAEGQFNSVKILLPKMIQSIEALNHVKNKDDKDDKEEDNQISDALYTTSQFFSAYKHAFLAACQRGDLQMVAYLIEQYQSISQTTKEIMVLQTPLRFLIAEDKDYLTHLLRIGMYGALKVGNIRVAEQLWAACHPEQKKNLLNPEFFWIAGLVNLPTKEDFKRSWMNHHPSARQIGLYFFTEHFIHDLSVREQLVKLEKLMHFHFDNIYLSIDRIKMITEWLCTLDKSVIKNLLLTMNREMRTFTIRNYPDFISAANFNVTEAKQHFNKFQALPLFSAFRDDIYAQAELYRHIKVQKLVTAEVKQFASPLLMPAAKKEFDKIMTERDLHEKKLRLISFIELLEKEPIFVDLANTYLYQKPELGIKQVLMQAKNELKKIPESEQKPSAKKP